MRCTGIPAYDVQRAKFVVAISIKLMSHSSEISTILRSKLMIYGICINIQYMYKYARLGEQTKCKYNNNILY